MTHPMIARAAAVLVVIAVGAVAPINEPWAQERPVNWKMASAVPRISIPPLASRRTLGRRPAPSSKLPAGQIPNQPLPERDLIVEAFD